MAADSFSLAPLLRPSTALPPAAEQRHYVVPLLLATAAALLFSIVAVPRLDVTQAVSDALDRDPGAAQMTPHEREQKIDQGRKVAALAAYSGAAFGTAFTAFAAAIALWLAFRVVGSGPGFVPTFTVICWSLLPGALAALLAIPAALLRSNIPVEQLPSLLPSNLAAFLPIGTSGPLAALLGALDLFSIWSAWIIAAGMAGVARITLNRSLVTVLVLWISYVGVFRVALPTLMGAR